MESYSYILDIALILLSTKLFGIISRKCQMPQVVGALFAGLILGPACLNIVHETEFLTQLAEIGVILLMFFAGLETDVEELKNSGKASLVIAILGIIVPLLGGFLVSLYFNREGVMPFSHNGNILLQNIFIGTILTATSVSITVEALREMGKLEGKVGNAVLGAAVIDDIIGIIVLTIVISMKDTSVSIAAIMIKILLYAVIMIVLGFLLNRFKEPIDKNLGKRRITTYIVAACFIVSYATETFFGIADITGAYLMGLFFSQHRVKKEIARKITVPSYLFFSPIFFASVGLKVELGGLTGKLMIFSLLLLLVAVLTKIIGCGLGAKICGFTARESLQVGVGMVSRGEVALIIAQKGFAVGLITADMFPPIVLVVIATTIITPVILRKIM